MTYKNKESKFSHEYNVYNLKNYYEQVRKHEDQKRLFVKNIKFKSKCEACNTLLDTNGRCKYS
ncbi:hypothetical protein COD11_21610 [Bacillus sp. AFS040349]|nr:hypothetical protein COD11_21610 [Bacillus sp. AFS040349]